MAEVIHQVMSHNLQVVSVQKINRELFVLFTATGIYLWGDDKKIKKYLNKKEN